MACPAGCWTTPALSSAQLAGLVVRHFPVGVVPQTGLGIRETAYAVARAESGGNPTACGDACRSFGPWQVFTGVWPYTAEQLFDPEFSAAVSFSPISSGGLNWNPWCTWEPTACGGVGNSSYRAFLSEAAAALGAPAPPPPPPPTATVLTGTVSSVGRALAGAVVTAFPEQRAALTGAGGGYSLAGLLAGDHLVTVSAPGHTAVSFAVTLGAGTNILNVALNPLVPGTLPPTLPPPLAGGTSALLLAGVVAAAAIVAFSAPRTVIVKKKPLSPAPEKAIATAGR